MKKEKIYLTKSYKQFIIKYLNNKQLKFSKDQLGNFVDSILSFRDYNYKNNMKDIIYEFMTKERKISRNKGIQISSLGPQSTLKSQSHFSM